MYWELNAEAAKFFQLLLQTKKRQKTGGSIMWECPNCHEKNYDHLTYCEKCQSDRPAKSMENGTYRPTNVMQNGTYASAGTFGVQETGHVAVWMYIVSFIFPFLGWYLMTGLVARNDDRAALKVFITTLMPTIILAIITLVAISQA